MFLCACLMCMLAHDVSSDVGVLRVVDLRTILTCPLQAIFLRRILVKILDLSLGVAFLAESRSFWRRICKVASVLCRTTSLWPVRSLTLSDVRAWLTLGAVPALAHSVTKEIPTVLPLAAVDTLEQFWVLSTKLYLFHIILPPAGHQDRRHPYGSPRTHR